MTHKIVKCRHCGKVIMQCRCPAKDKEVELSDCGCQDKATVPSSEGECICYFSARNGYKPHSPECPLAAPATVPIGKWVEEFYKLTKTMDGQHRPKLKLLIEQLIARAREETGAKYIGGFTYIRTPDAITYERRDHADIRVKNACTTLIDTLVEEVTKLAKPLEYNKIGGPNERFNQGLVAVINLLRSKREVISKEENYD